MEREDIYNPLEQYQQVYRDRFAEVAARTFEELANASGVDVAANRATCKEIRSLTTRLENTKSRQTRWRFLCGFLYSLIAVGALMGWWIVDSGYTSFELDDYSNKMIVVGIIVAAVAVLCLLFFKVHPKLRAIGKERKSLEQKIAALTSMAWEQMEPLNKLYDWDIFARMMSETVPKLEFDPFFTTQRLEDLKRVYGWDDSFNEERSVLYSHSGLINGNPFVLCRTKMMVMGSKTYYGEKTIHWTTHERNSEGKMVTVHHSETLTASFTAPFPEYYEKTRLIYGNVAAPDLCFARTKNTFSGEQGSFSYKWKLRNLKKQAEKTNSNFVLMQNEDFEVFFNTANRNHEQQYRLLFTPLAQQSMLDILRDESVGYGDDFDFSKERMINVIVADHVQSIEFDMNPTRFRHYDFDLAKENFTRLNAEYFRAIYFCLAPLLCIPAYQQIRTRENIYGFGSKPKSSFWEHEALANFWGEENFKHPRSVTENILKTSEKDHGNGNSTITVTAYGYEALKRVYVAEKWGGDGKLHSVPVVWYEYLPVEGSGSIQISEDVTDDAKLTPTQRHSHITDRLSNVGGNAIYRRHIASRL